MSLIALLLVACTSDPSNETGPEDTDVPGPEVTIAADNLSAPRDAAADADASGVWYIAEQAPGDYTVFDASTGGAVTDGFSMLHNLVLASSQPRVWATGVGDDGPTLVSISLLTGGVDPVPGSGAYEPMGLDLTVEDGADVLWFSGFDPESGEPGVFRVDTTSKAITKVGTAPLDEPAGLARAADGSVWLAGRREGRGEIHRVDGSGSTRLLTGFRLGDPGGVALTLDDSTLLISSLSEDGASQALLMNTESGETIVFNDQIGANRASGGLHRALHENTFVWVDATGGGAGTVYRIRL